MTAPRPPIFAELCCGSAAVTLRLLGGPYAKPPVSYMGSKRGYATSILAAMGLRPGQGADAVLLCDPGPWSRVWAVLSTPEGCRAVAAIIRGWVGEEPRALWERLRAEGPLSGTDGVAQYVMLAASNRLINGDFRDGRWANTGKGGTTHGGEEFATGAGEVAGAVGELEGVRWPREVAGYLTLGGMAFRQGDPESGFAGPAGANGGRMGCPLDRAATSADRMPSWPSTAILSASASTIDPREVAAWLWVTSNTHGSGESGGFKASDPADVMRSRARHVDPVALGPRIGAYIRERREAAGLSRVFIDRAVGGNTICAFWEGRTVDGRVEYRVPSWANWLTLKEVLGLDDRFDGVLRPVPGTWSVSVPDQNEIASRVEGGTLWPPLDIATDARLPIPDRLPPGSVAYIDPPYENTTGYANDLPRSEVLEIARRWKDAGALVVISEAEPLPLAGWHHVEITGERVGQKRTFSKQQAEWLTMSAPPVVRPSVQVGLFGSAA